MYTHWQNLTGRSGFWKARRWFMWEKLGIEFEWMFGPYAHDHHFQLNIGGEESDKLALNIGLHHLFNIWIVLSGQWLAKLPYRQYNTGFSTCDGYVFLYLWSPVVHCSTDERRKILFDPLDVLCGRSKYSKRTINTYHDVPIDLPDSTYFADIELFESTWKRPRWPFPLRIIRASIDVKEGIPVPPRGYFAELNGMSEDAVYSLTLTASTLDEAIQHTISHILEDRRK